MESGVFIFDTDYSIDIVELARELEQRGFDALFVPEHTHIPASRLSPWPGGADLPKEYWHTYDPFVSLSFAAAATQKLKIGTGICLLPQRDTILAAKLTASLDRMSGGRFIFGVGAGWNKEELEHHGEIFETRFKRLEEQLQAVKGLWTEEEFGFEGKYVTFTPSWSHPKPAQPKGPPIILGGESDHTLKRIMKYADGWLPRGRHGFDAGEHMTRFRHAAEEAGRDPKDLTVTIFGASAKPDALESYREAGITRALFPLPSEGRDKILPLLDKYQAAL